MNRNLFNYILLSFLTVFALNSKLHAETSLYTYDCNVTENTSDFPTYVHLTQNFKEGITINRQAVFLEYDKDVQEPGQKHEQLYFYQPSSESSLAMSIVLIGPMGQGAASGKTVLVRGESSATYSCSLDWSPY